ncbi:MAG: hypothetical protein ABSE84_25705 [Isosphaeraceae bacterium]|jgi:hypothetical protein
MIYPRRLDADDGGRGLAEGWDRTLKGLSTCSDSRPGVIEGYLDENPWAIVEGIARRRDLRLVIVRVQ